jgi:hypothetical protein
VSYNDLGSITPEYAFEMNNAAGAPLQCLGFVDLPVYHEIDHIESFNDGALGWQQDPRLTARELAMLAVMNFITDTKDWQQTFLMSKRSDNDDITRVFPPFTSL